MKYDLSTSSVNALKGNFAKVISIPKLQSISINTFNMIFEVIYISAWVSPLIERYGISLKNNDIALTKLTTTSSDGEGSVDNVGYVIGENFIDVYVKAITEKSNVYINVIGATSTDYSIKYDYASFVTGAPKNIIYATVKENSIVNVLDGFIKSNVNRTLSGTKYHSGNTLSIGLPEINRSYFGIVSDSSARIAYIHITTSNALTITNLGTTNIECTLDTATKTLNFSNLLSNRFLHYIMNYSY